MEGNDDMNQPHLVFQNVSKIKTCYDCVYDFCSSKWRECSFWKQIIISQIRKENPNASDCEIGKKMVDQWNHLSKEEREHYEELSKKDQEARKKAKHG